MGLGCRLTLTSVLFKFVWKNTNKYIAACATIHVDTQPHDILNTNSIKAGHGLQYWNYVWKSSPSIVIICYAHVCVFLQLSDKC